MFQQRTILTQTTAVTVKIKGKKKHSAPTLCFLVRRSSVLRTALMRKARSESISPLPLFPSVSRPCQAQINTVRFNSTTVSNSSRYYCLVQSYLEVNLSLVRMNRLDKQKGDSDFIILAIINRIWCDLLRQCPTFLLLWHFLPREGFFTGMHTPHENHNSINTPSYVVLRLQERLVRPTEQSIHQLPDHKYRRLSLFHFVAAMHHRPFVQDHTRDL